MNISDRLLNIQGFSTRYSSIQNDINSISSELRELSSIQIKSEEIFIYKRLDEYIIEYVLFQKEDKVLRIKFVLHFEDKNSIPTDITSKVEEKGRVLTYRKDYNR